MNERIQVVRPGDSAPIELAGAVLTIGRSGRNDIAIADDPTVSRMHAILERLAGGWLLRDLGSANGTFLNGKVVHVHAHLEPGDEIKVGCTRLVVRVRRRVGQLPPPAVPVRAPPRLTVRELDVLAAMLRPTVGGDIIGHLALPREVAAALGVTEATVRHHLANLYGKFDIPRTGGRRQVRLAREAICRGVDPRDVGEPGRASRRGRAER